MTLFGDSFLEKFELSLHHQSLILPLKKEPMVKTKIADHTKSIISTAAAPYLRYIREGKKHAEGRINAPSYAALKVGDTICFHSPTEGIICEITFLHRYRSFREMLEREGAQRMLPQLAGRNLSPEACMVEGVKIYERFPKAGRVAKMGCLAIGVKYLRERSL